MKAKTTEEKVKSVAYTYAGELLKVWYESVISDVSEVAEGAAEEIPELAGQGALIENCIRDAVKDVYEHASAYADMRFALEFHGIDGSIADTVKSILN